MGITKVQEFGEKGHKIPALIPLSPSEDWQ
jgi:hypothetical protein